MKQTGKAYWRESIECFLFITLFMALFLAVFVISGRLNRMDWLNYFDHFTWTFNTEFFKDLMQSWK